GRRARFLFRDCESAEAGFCPADQAQPAAGRDCRRNAAADERARDLAASHHGGAETRSYISTQNAPCSDSQISAPAFAKASVAGQACNGTRLEPLAEEESARC